MIAEWAHRDVTQLERCWKLFLFLPRMASLPSLSWKEEQEIGGSFSSVLRWPVRVAHRTERSRLMSELAAARQALESAGMAPGDRTTLNSLRNPERRPVAPRELPAPELMTLMPHRPFDLHEDVFCRNLRSARRGAAPGPFGMSCEHLQSERDMGSLCQVTTLLARGDVVPSALRILRMARFSIAESRWWSPRHRGE